MRRLSQYALLPLLMVLGVLTLGSADRRAARTQPALPAPTMM